MTNPLTATLKERIYRLTHGWTHKHQRETHSRAPCALMACPRIMTSNDFYKLNSRRRRLDKYTAYVLLEMFMGEHGLCELGWKGEIGTDKILVDGIEHFPKGCYAGAKCIYGEKL